MFRFSYKKKTQGVVWKAGNRDLKETQKLTMTNTKVLPNCGHFPSKFCLPQHFLMIKSLASL